eukprot:5499452-Prymnesium_polylepis.1
MHEQVNSLWTTFDEMKAKQLLCLEAKDTKQPAIMAFPTFNQQWKPYAQHEREEPARLVSRRRANTAPSPSAPARATTERRTIGKRAQHGQNASTIYSVQLYGTERQNMTVWAAQRGLRRPLGPPARLKRRHGEVERPHRRCFGRAASAQ